MLPPTVSSTPSKPAMFSLPTDPLYQTLLALSHGTPLRLGLDAILTSNTGGLLVITDDPTICETTFPLRTPFTPSKLSELSKMSGAVLLSSNRRTLLGANAFLSPEKTPTTETSPRHRLAERTARQLGCAVVAVSQEAVVFVGEARYVLSDVRRLRAECARVAEAAEFYVRGLEEAVGALLVAKDGIGDLVLRAAQVHEKLRRCVRTLGWCRAEMGVEGDVVRARVLRVVEAGNAAVVRLAEMEAGGAVAFYVKSDRLHGLEGAELADLKMVEKVFEKGSR